MQVTVEDISSVKKTLHVEISQQEVAREIDKAYDEIRRTAKIKGFRPGKTPRAVLEKMFRKDVLADVSSRLIQSSLIDAIREKDLRLVGRPDLVPPELDVAQAYKYAATIEVTPPIADVDFKGLTLKRSTYQVSEAEVDAQLKALQKNLAKLQPIAESRPARDGDHLLITFEGFQGGKPCADTPRTESFTVKLGSGAVLKEFDEQLAGMTAGASKEFPVTFPADYQKKSLAGQTVDFHVTLNDIREQILPEIDDELARRAGRYDSLDALKQEITANLRQGYDKRIEQELNEQAFSGLLARTSFEVPEALVEAELEGIVEEAERSFSYRNTTLEDMGLTRESIKEKYRETAVKQVKRHLLLGKLIEQEKLEVDGAEVEQAMVQMAASFQQPIEHVRRYYRENAEKLDYFKHALLEKKATRMIIDGSTIEDVAPDAKS
jgi:trigger factor